SPATDHAPDQHEQPESHPHQPRDQQLQDETASMADQFAGDGERIGPDRLRPGPVRLRRDTSTRGRAVRRPRRGASDQQMIAEGFKEVYFQDGGVRAMGLSDVAINEIDYLGLDF
ncbi:hypothetical protein ACFRMR_19235, partial [Streptomyces sp. NPDC056817]